jgi:hypothetical protein
MATYLLAFRIALFALGSLSIGSLLLYFFGIATFVTLSTVLISVEIVGLIGLTWYAWSHKKTDATRLLVGGLWAGCLATLAYDVVRIPIIHSGIPVFKAISYFGTVLLGVDRPTASSEFLGWTYHFSNGVSFALMYVALAGGRPGPATAVLWGLLLEGAMLVTPYAEVFGYQRDLRFMSITIGSHAVYGYVMWLALRSFGSGGKLLDPRWIIAGLLTVPIGLSATAVDFNSRFAPKIPQSPPPYIGSHLYTVWNVPEPDRVAVIWVMSRFVERDAVFYFIEPFDKPKFGKPFDLPEAQIRRTGTQSATEGLVADHHLRNDPKLAALAHMTELTEITPWQLASDREAGWLADRLRTTADTKCGKRLSSSCLPALLSDLDEWYRSPQ